MGYIFKGGGHGYTEFVGFGEYIGIKKRLTNNAHGDVRHLLVDIDNAIVAPGLLDLLTIVSEYICIAHNMTELEGRRHDFALATMKLAFAAEDAIAEDGTEGIMYCQTFIEVIGMLDENTMDVLRFIEQNSGERPEMHSGDIAFASHMS